MAFLLGSFTNIFGNLKKTYHDVSTTDFYLSMIAIAILLTNGADKISEYNENAVYLLYLIVALLLTRIFRKNCNKYNYQQVIKSILTMVLAAILNFVQVFLVFTTFIEAIPFIGSGIIMYCCYVISFITMMLFYTYDTKNC